jgi:hypothetical protein
MGGLIVPTGLANKRQFKQTLKNSELYEQEENPLIAFP